MKKISWNLLLILLLSLGIAGCKAGYRVLHKDLPVIRPSDGLLANKTLQAVAELQQAGDAAELRKLLTHSDASVRARAAFAFGSVQDAEAMPLLLSLLDDGSANVRRDAAFAIRQSTAEADPELLYSRFLAEPNREVRMVLLGTLGFKGNVECYDKIFGKRYDGLEKAQALCACYYLSRGIFSETGVDFMLGLLDGENADVWNHAAVFFSNFPEKDERIAQRFRVLLSERGYGFSAAPYLIKYIGKLGGEGDIQLFEEWSQNSDRQLGRVFALQALGFHDKNPGVRKYLIDMLEHSEPAMAYTAADLLNNSKQLSGYNLNQLAKLLDEKRIDRNEVPYVLEILWNAGRRGTVYQYIDAIPDADPLEYVVAIHRLQELEWGRSKDRLQALYGVANNQVALLVNECLSHKIFKATKSESRILQKHLLEYVQSIPNSSVRVDCLIGIAECMAANPADYDQKAFFSELAEIYLKADDAYSAAICLVRLGHLQDESVRPLIEKGLAHRDPFIVAAAKGALSFYGMKEKEDFCRYKFTFNPPMEFDWKLLRRYGRFPHVKLYTSKGEIAIRLDAEQTPKSAQNLIMSINEGLFDNASFYRFLPSFVSQVGAVGQNGRSHPAEFSHQLMEYHVVNAGGPSKDCMSQHLIISHLLRPDRELAGPTIGYVVEGHDVCDRLARFDVVYCAEVIPSNK